MHYYRKRIIYALIVLLVIFVFVFFVTYALFKKNILIFDLGMPYGLENIIVMFFSIAAIVKVVFDINMVESHRTYEQRMKKIL